MAKKGCLGCSFPVLIVIGVVFLAILVMGFLAGPIGSNFFPDLTFLDWMRVDNPKPELPATEIFSLFGLPVTNTILSGWVTCIFLIAFSYIVTHRMKIIPGRVQSAFEGLVGWLYDQCTGIAGEENGRRFFPMIATIFLFVAFNGWLSLIPGFGSITVNLAHGHHTELFRGANTDLNTTLSIALIAFGFIEYHGFRANGIPYLKEFFNFGRFINGHKLLFTGKIKSGFGGIFLGIIDMFVGILELFSHFIRIISFMFRLFGNMTAGEILLLVTAFLIPWLLAIPFYGLELFFGFVQAFIFSGLTLAFAAMAATPHEAEAH